MLLLFWGGGVRFVLTSTLTVRIERGGLSNCNGLVQELQLCYKSCCSCFITRHSYRVQSMFFWLMALPILRNPIHSVSK
jgi:hypothetical protein